jgi:hypothetical protein
VPPRSLKLANVTADHFEAGAYRVYKNPADLLDRLAEICVQPQ